MDPSTLGLVGIGVCLGLQAATLCVQLAMLSILAYRSRERRIAPYVDVSPHERKGELPGGTWAITGGLLDDQPVSPSGVVVVEVKSERTWVFEVWARTDQGWVQLQPGRRRTAPDGSVVTDATFRNALVAGSRLAMLRLWLARTDEDPDESGVRQAAGLLVPAAVFLSRARPELPIDRSGSGAAQSGASATPGPARSARPDARSSPPEARSSLSE